MAKFKTVGELKDYLSAIDDNTPILLYHSGMEQSGWFNSVFVNTDTMVEKTYETWDRFDGVDYSYNSFEYDENGQKCLKFS